MFIIGRRRQKTRDRGSYREDNEIEEADGAQHSRHRSNGTTKKPLPTLSSNHKKEDRGLNRTGVPGANPRRPKSVHVRGMNFKKDHYETLDIVVQ